MATLKLRDATIHYESAGSGAPLLLIQGAGVAGSAWQPQVDGLSNEFHCLWFDNRGFGRSRANQNRLTIKQMAEDARALMESVGWESAHIAGHSMGD